MPLFIFILQLLLLLRRQIKEQHPSIPQRRAPAISAVNDPGRYHLDTPDLPSIIIQAFLLFLLLYITLGIFVYSFNLHPFVDALYFCIVTMCTIGYGDITPATASPNIFPTMFLIIGFDFVDLSPGGMVTYVLEIQESLLLSDVNKPTKIDDKKKHNQ